MAQARRKEKGFPKIHFSQSVERGVQSLQSTGVRAYKRCRKRDTGWVKVKQYHRYKQATAAMGRTQACVASGEGAKRRQPVATRCGGPARR
jgi:hypothetical protein